MCQKGRFYWVFVCVLHENRGPAASLTWNTSTTVAFTYPLVNTKSDQAGSYFCFRIAVLSLSWRNKNTSVKTVKNPTPPRRAMKEMLPREHVEAGIQDVVPPWKVTLRAHRVFIYALDSDLELK